MIKQIMIPLAAFAITVTGASAFNSDMLEKLDVDLTDSQISTLTEMHELRESGAGKDEIKATLEEVGLDADKMKEIRKAIHEVRKTTREAVHTALENNDYNAFRTAIADTPLAEAIDTEADFETFKAAHELKESGDHEAAQELMAELGIKKPEGRGRGHGDHGHHGKRVGNSAQSVTE